MHEKLLFKKIFLWAFQAIICVLLLSCHKDDDLKGSGKLNIVATTGMLEDAVKNIVKDSAEVKALMGPGVDPHLYKASHGDLRKLVKAEMILYNGLHLEGKMGEVFRRLARKKHVVAAASGLNQNQLRKNASFKENADPHIWFDVLIWRQAVQYIGDRVIEADPKHAVVYKKNLEDYLNKLDTLDLWVKKQISTIPKGKRVLITAHDAFGYFGDAYGIEVRGLQGLSTLSDYGLNDITSLVNLISERRIKAIFVESSVSRRSIDAVVEGCRAKGHDVQVGGTLYSDALGTPGSNEATYIGMVQYNVNTIVNALR